MGNNLIKILFGFIVLLLLQEFLFNNIELGIYVNIYIYVMFILLLPASFSRLTVLLLSGAMGLSVDLFCGNILGVNMAACLLAGYARPYILKMVTTSADVPQEVPTVRRSEFRKVLTYTIVLVLIHHFVLFSLEAFSISKLFYVLIRTIASTVMSVIFIIVAELLLARK